MPRVSRITLYPVKALPGVSVREAVLTESGALMHDRAYALTNHAGRYINGKLNPRVHALDAACAVEGDAVRVTLRDATGAQSFQLGPQAPPCERDALLAHLARHFSEPVSLLHDGDGGFPDDDERPGPTLLAEASLSAVASWFAPLDSDAVRRRFRANIELADCPAFWEDQLFGDAGVDVAFRIGDAQFFGTNPCLRCVVPTRDPATGDEWTGFQRTFVQQRKATLPAWANRARFDFYYRLSLNTRAADGQRGKAIRVGDPVEILPRV